MRRTAAVVQSITALTQDRCPTVGWESPMAECPGAFLRLRSVIAITGMGKSWIYEAIKSPTDPFPKPYKLSDRAVAWSEREVRQWMADRPRADASEAA